MSDSQSNGRAIYRGPRYANGDPVPVAELDMIAQAFGFSSAQKMDEVCAYREAQRAHRRAADEARIFPRVGKKAS